MDDKQIIVLTGYDIAEIGWYLGFGAAGGAVSVIGLAFIVLGSWELAVRKRKNALEGEWYEDQ